MSTRQAKENERSIRGLAALDKEGRDRVVKEGRSRKHDSTEKNLQYEKDLALDSKLRNDIPRDREKVISKAKI